ncbi:MAG: M3 family metallopeptidase, partial [Vulcanimicrobiaceae bacterium]
MTETGLPHWDMEVVYPSLQSVEFHSAFTEVELEIESLEGYFHEHGIDKGTQNDVEVFDEVVKRYNTLVENMRTVGGFVHAFTSTNSRDEFAAAKDSEVDQLQVRARKLYKHFLAWVGALDLEHLLAESDAARAHEYPLIKAKIQASHLMRAGEEMLASELEITGLIAWSKLHHNITSQLSAPADLGDGPQTLPMSVLRNMAYDQDRNRRQAAFHAELAAWKTVEVPVCAAMNGVKGEVLTLGKHRKWEDPLDEALLNSNIDRGTLDAMLLAAREAFPVFRRYLKAKASAMGVEKLAFYDIFAPLGAEEKRWDYADACDFVVRQFGKYSSKLSDFAARAFRENWIDAESRSGKGDGAFCMSLRRDESRILLNFKPSFGSVSTMAHELGHGYHNLCLFGRTPLQRATPMTLA